MTAEPLWRVGGYHPSKSADRAATPSFDALYREHYARLHRFVLGMTRRDPVAEDIAQETLLRAFLHWDDLDPSRPAWPWLKKVATRLVYDQWRAQSSPVVDEGEEPTVPDTGVAYADRQLVGQMLDALPERQRAAVTLRYLDDWKSAEIAAVLGLPRPAVEQLLLRARRSLQIEYRRLSGDRLRLALWPLLAWSLRLRQRVARGVEVVGDRALPALAATAESMSALVVAGALSVGAGLAGAGGDPAPDAAGYPDMLRAEAMAVISTASRPDIDPNGTVPSPLLRGAAPARSPRATHGSASAVRPSSGIAERSVDIASSGATVADQGVHPRARTEVVRDTDRDELHVSSDLIVDMGQYGPQNDVTVDVPCGNGMTTRAMCDAYDAAAGASPDSR